MKHSFVRCSLALAVALPFATAHRPPVAHAAEAADPSKSPAKDDILLTQGEVSSLEKKLADTTDWAVDQKARNNARAATRGVAGGIARIRAADPKWNLTAWEALVKKAEARLKKADEDAAKIEGDNAKVAEVFYRFRSEAGKVEGPMKLLESLANKPSAVAIETDQTFTKTVASITAVATLEKFCKDSSVATLPVPVGEGNVKAGEKCKLASRWRELGKSYVTLQAEGGVKREGERFAAVIEKAKKGEAVDVARHKDLLDPKRTIERLKEVYVPGAKTFDLTLADSVFEPLVSSAQPYAAALADAGKTLRWDAAAKLQDATLAAAVAGDYAKGSDLGEGKVVRHGAFSDWSVDKDPFDRPVKRYRDAVFLVQMKGEAYCRVYSRSFESLFNNGAWGRPYSKGGFASFRVSSCK